MAKPSEKKRRDSLTRRIQNLDKALDLDVQSIGADIPPATKATMLAEAENRLTLLDFWESDAAELGPDAAGMDPRQAITALRDRNRKLIESLKAEGPVGVTQEVKGQDESGPGVVEVEPVDALPPAGQEVVVGTQEAEVESVVIESGMTSEVEPGHVGQAANDDQEVAEVHAQGDGEVAAPEQPSGETAEQLPTTGTDILTNDAGDPLPKAARQVITVQVADLKPNMVNCKVFAESLGPEAIADLAKDIEVHGLRQPIEIRPDKTIVDGERRWRALKLLGIETTEVFVVETVKTDDDLSAFIIDAQQSTRRTSVVEKVNLFKLALTVLRQRHGRGRGRPGKTVRTEPNFWTTDQIEGEAAKKAGFSSASIASKAEAVVAKADAALLDLVNSGEMSLSGAYDRLLDAASPKTTGPRTGRTKVPKPAPCAATAATTPTPVMPSPTTDATAPAVGAASPPAALPVAAVPPGLPDKAVKAATTSTVPDSHEPAAETTAASVELVPDAPESWSQSFDKAMNAVVEILAAVAKENQEFAKALMDSATERLKALRI